MKKFVIAHGGSIAAFLLIVMGYFFPSATAGLLEGIVELMGAVFGLIAKFVPAEWGGSIPLSVLKAHNAIVGLAEMIATLPTRLIPQTLLDLFPSGLGQGIVNAVKIIFGVVLIYFEYRFFRIVWLILKGIWYLVTSPVWAYQTARNWLHS